MNLRVEGPFTGNDADVILAAALAGRGLVDALRPRPLS